jgi:hypothetical protein
MATQTNSTKGTTQPATTAATSRSARRQAQKDQIAAAGVVLAEAVEAEDVLDPATNAVVDKATAVYVKLSQQFAEQKLDISEKELATLTAAIDLIETRMDEKIEAALVKANAYTDEKVADLSNKTETTFIDMKDVLVKTNERIDDVDARVTAAMRVPLGAYIVGAVAAVITFFIWISTANFQQNIKLPDGKIVMFPYELFNGPFGGLIAAVLVFAVIAFIGSFVKIERPLRREPKVIKAKVHKNEEPKAIESTTASDTPNKE